MTEREFAANLRAMLAEASPGPFMWGSTPDAVAFLAETAQRTLDHGDAQSESWVVQTLDPNDPVTVAFSGNGPRAHRNAELIAYLLNNAAAIAALAATPPASALDVERLARAIEAADAHEWDLGGAPKWAAAIAREYAALAPQAPDAAEPRP